MSTQRVDFHGYDDSGSPAVVGIILLDNGRLSAKPDYMRDVLGETLIVRDGDTYKKVTTRDPQEFLNSLHLYFHGSRFRASEPVDVEDDAVPVEAKAPAAAPAPVPEADKPSLTEEYENILKEAMGGGK